MKTLKFSNIILIILGLSFVILIILKVLYSTYEYESNYKTNGYSEIKINNYKPFKHLVISAFKQVTFGIRTGNEFRMEVLNNTKYIQSVKSWYHKDTLFINVFNKDLYIEYKEINEALVTIPFQLKSITAKNIICNITDIKQDSIYIKAFDNSEINVENTDIKYIDCKSKTSTLCLYHNNKINTLVFKDLGNYSSVLELNDIAIDKLNIINNSTNVKVKGKAIDYYLNIKK